MWWRKQSPIRPLFGERSLGIILVETMDREHEAAQKRPIIQSGISTRIFVFFMLAITLMLAYLVTRSLTLFAPGYTLLDRFSGMLLLVSELFVTIQTLGYYIYVWTSVDHPNIAHSRRLAVMRVPSVSIYIATYNEPAEVIEETVAAVSLLDYPNKQIYVNCDHQSEEQATMVAAIAARHGIHCIHRVPNSGYKAGGINAFLARLGHDLPATDLLCILDADSVPQPSFLREIIPYFDDDPRLAFVQAPQHYGNTGESLLTAAAGCQQDIFFEYICEGKQNHDAMFFCGTNGIFRVNALRDIGGLLTTSITEDFATSIKLHARGWRSQYCNVAYVTGMGPTSLGGYWVQQNRWAFGNLQTFLASLRDIFLYRGFTPAQRWEYFISGTYYFIGVNTFIGIFCPSLFLLAGIRPIIMSPILYFVAFLPHIVLSYWFTFYSMGKRGYSFRLLVLSQCLNIVTFPAYMAAFVAAITGRKKAFAVTPKGGDQRLPLKSLSWHLLAMVLLASAIGKGIYHLIFDQNIVIAINIAWCLYHIAQLATVFLFNE